MWQYKISFISHPVADGGSCSVGIVNVAKASLIVSVSARPAFGRNFSVRSFVRLFVCLVLSTLLPNGADIYIYIFYLTVTPPACSSNLFQKSFTKELKRERGLETRSVFEFLVRESENLPVSSGQISGNPPHVLKARRLKTQKNRSHEGILNDQPLWLHKGTFFFPNSSQFLKVTYL